MKCKISLFAILMPLVISGCLIRESNFILEPSESLLLAPDEWPAGWRMVNKEMPPPTASLVFYYLEKQDERIDATVSVSMFDTYEQAIKYFLPKKNDTELKVTPEFDLEGARCLIREGNQEHFYYNVYFPGVILNCLVYNAHISVQIMPSYPYILHQDAAFNYEKNKNNSIILAKVVLDKVIKVAENNRINRG